MALPYSNSKITFLKVFIMNVFILVSLDLRSEVSKKNNLVITPNGVSKEQVYQLKIQFPDEILRTSAEVFKVECQPVMKGYSSWADNNTIWTYTFISRDIDSNIKTARLEGGSSCRVEQILDIKSKNGQAWKNKDISYNVSRFGPTVKEITLPKGYKNELRETNPVVLIRFDGQIDKNKFFSQGQAYFSYTSSNAPSEKIYLKEVPETELLGLVEYFKTTEYFRLDTEKTDWVMATVQQNLIPGSELNLTINNLVSRFNSQIINQEKSVETLKVRSLFKAELSCTSSSIKKDRCLSKGQIQIYFQGQVKWNDVKDAYIQFIAAGEKNSKPVKTFALIPADRKLGPFDTFIYYISQYVPYVASLSDIVTDQIEFDVQIEPETEAQIIIPSELKDLDQRKISQSTTRFVIKIDSLNDVIRTPKIISYFEKEVKDLSLPIGVVNLNQDILITRTGTNDQWQPVRDAKSMIRLIKDYSRIISQSYEDKPKKYRSPLKDLNKPFVEIKQKLTGDKNRRMVLKYPFASKLQPQNIQSGLYPFEITSSTFAKEKDRPVYPKHVLAQVTDLALHFKRGEKNILFWVTKLSTGEPIANSKISLFDCIGESLDSFSTNNVGLAQWNYRESKSKCDTDSNYSSYNQNSEFFAMASTENDQVLAHSSWRTSSGYATYAPNVSYVYSDVSDNNNHFQAVVGVNLVKPGQSVPLQIFAKKPTADGFAEIPESELPKMARIYNSEDDEISFDIPITWNFGHANLTWDIPSEDNIKLGTYRLVLVGKDSFDYVSGSDIEIAEFKVPLMAAQLTLSNETLIQPDQISITNRVQYANGVGANELPFELTYFFIPTAMTGEKNLAGFNFGNGTVSDNFESSEQALVQLPTSDRPTVVENLKTTVDGTLTRDIGQDLTAQGASVSAAIKANNRPVQLIVRSRYLDQSGEYQTLSQSKVIYNSDKYMGTNVVPGTRETALLQLVTVDTNQKIMTDISDFNLKVLKIETKVIGEELFGGLIKNTFEREIKTVQWNKKCSLANGIYSCAVGTLKSGVYAVQSELKSNKQVSHAIFKIDESGRVYSENAYSSFGENEDSYFLPLTAHKETYKANEKATLSFSSPFKKCYALVTLERSDIISGQVFSDICEKGHFDIQLDGALAPNVYASLLAVSGRASQTAQQIGDLDIGRPTYKIGFANLKIGWEKFTAAVDVQTDKNEYKPKETVHVEVNVKPLMGQLLNPKITVVVIEEKILELKPNETYKLLESLMQQRKHNVLFVTPLESIETAAIVNSDLADQDKNEKGGDEGGDGSSKSEFKRKLFNALVNFQTDVPVINGVAKVAFKTNDSLTKFKIFVIAYDDQNKYGTGTAQYISSQDHQIYSNIPVVARTEDQFPIVISLQNNTSQVKNYKIKTEVVIKDAQGKIIEIKNFDKTQQVHSSSAETTQVGLLDLPENASSASYIVSVYDENGQLVDQLEVPQQQIANSKALRLRDSFIEQMQSKIFDRVLTKNEMDGKDKGEVKIVATKSLVTAAGTQIMQKIANDTFADFMMDSKIYKALVLSTEKDQSQLATILASLQLSMDYKGLIKPFQNSAKGDVWITAEILTQLKNEKWAHSLIPEKVQKKLAKTIEKFIKDELDLPDFSKNKLAKMTAQVMMARASLGFNDQSLRDLAQKKAKEVKINLEKNSLYYELPIDKWSNKTLVEILLLDAELNDAKTLKSEAFKSLNKRLIYMGNSASLQGQQSYNEYYSDESVETAQFLQGVCLLKADKSLARSLAVGLVNQGSFGKWYTTTTLVNIYSSLKSFARVYEEQVVTGQSVITMEGSDQVINADFDKNYAAVLEDKWLTEKSTVQVKHSGQGLPWISTEIYTLNYSSENKSQGMSVQKSIRNLNRSSGYKAGDIIQVELRLTAAQPLSRVVLFDPIPAGANVIGSVNGDVSQTENSAMGVKFLVQELSAMTVVYQYQLNNKGRFNLPRTEMKALYVSSISADFKNESINVE